MRIHKIVSWITVQSITTAAIGLLFLLSLAAVPISKAFATTTCDQSGAIGNASKDFTVPTGSNGTYKAWLELYGSATSTVGVEVLNNSCTKKTLSNLPTSFGWVDTGVVFDLTAGTKTFKLTAYSGGLTVRNVMLIANEDCKPVGAGNNCDTVIVTPPSPDPTPTPVPTPTPSPALLTVGTHDDSVFTYSAGWNFASSGQAENKYQGGDYYSNTVNSTVTIRFKGTAIQVFGARASWHGKLKTQLDGVAGAEIDQYNATRQDQYEIYSKTGLANSEHTLILTVSGTKNASSAGTYVSVDKAVVSASVIPSPTPIPTPTPTPTPVPTVVDPPTRLRASQSKGWWFSNQITFSWDKPANFTSKDTFEISFSGKNGTKTNYSQYTLTNAQYGATYEFWITTVKQDGKRSDTAKLRVTVNCNWFWCTN